MNNTIKVGEIIPFGTAKLPRGARIARVYQDSTGKFRWRLRYQHNILSDSGQGYADRPTALEAARRNAIPAGDFPVILEYDQRTGGELVWERVR